MVAQVTAIRYKAQHKSPLSLPRGVKSKPCNGKPHSSVGRAVCKTDASPVRVRLWLRTKKLINMVNIYKRYIKRQVVKAALPLGIDMTMRCADFVTSAPIWQWKKRLWVVTHAVGFLPKERLEVGMENLVLFLDE